MMNNNTSKILVIGATGQIGSELTIELRKRYGSSRIVAAGHKKKLSQDLTSSGPCVYMNVSQKKTIEKVIDDYDINIIYQLAAVLSASGEKNPNLAWKVNMNGLRNVLEIARKKAIMKVFWPSSIAAFGPDAPRSHAPQDSSLIPTTMYGINKVAGELLCNYYYERYNLDVRSVRYPGIISIKTLPGGGITDYAVDMFFKAVKGEKYVCFLKKNSRLPMMYMPDCIKAAIKIMESDSSEIRHHVAYNLAAMSFTPNELEEEIRKKIPEFECEYKPDFRQRIADSWPASMDDTVAQKEWGWEPEFDLSKMANDILQKLTL